MCQRDGGNSNQRAKPARTRQQRSKPFAGTSESTSFRDIPPDHAGVRPLNFAWMG